MLNKPTTISIFNTDTDTDRHIIQRLVDRQINIHRYKYTLQADKFKTDRYIIDRQIYRLINAQKDIFYTDKYTDRFIIQLIVAHTDVYIIDRKYTDTVWTDTEQQAETNNLANPLLQTKYMDNLDRERHKTIDRYIIGVCSDSSQTDSSQTDSSQTDSSQTDSSQTDSSQTNASYSNLQRQFNHRQIHHRQILPRQIYTDTILGLGIVTVHKLQLL